MEDLISSLPSFLRRTQYWERRTWLAVESFLKFYGGLDIESILLWRAHFWILIWGFYFHQHHNFCAFDGYTSTQISFISGKYYVANVHTYAVMYSPELSQIFMNYLSLLMRTYAGLIYIQNLFNTRLQLTI